MSRMIFAFSLLLIVSGCEVIDDGHHRLSVLTARVETLGPGARSCRTCSDCIPRRPFCSVYDSDWDNHITEHTAQRCAFRGLHEYKLQCGRPVSHHFKMGFIAAYEDLAMNRRPSPPIMPPPKYWNAYYRSCAGKPCVDEWFAGYDAGLGMGSNSGVSGFREVYLRRCGYGTVSADRLDYGQAALNDAVSPQAFQQSPLYPIPNMSGPNASAPNPYGNPYGLQGR